MNDESYVMELRKLFPVVDHWTYLYNGSIHPCAQPVAEAMQSFIKEWGNGGEGAFFPAFEAFGQLKEKFARLIHAEPENIVITESTTAGINLAAQIIRPKPEQNVVVTDLAFMSNTYLWLASQSALSDVRFVKSRNGKIYLSDLEAEIDDRTAAVHICAVTVGSGFRYDLAAVTAITKKRGVPLIVDAAQALGLIDLNVLDLSIDFLASTASKWLMGPAGVGFLYVSNRYLNATPPAVGWLSASNVGDWDVRHCELHTDSMRFQGGIPNLIGVVGALAGLELIEKIGREFIERRVLQLIAYLFEELKKIGVSIQTPQEVEDRAGIIFFTTPGYADLHEKLKSERIYCGSFLGGIRIDPNFYNTMEELDRFLAIVRTHVKK